MSEPDNARQVTFREHADEHQVDSGDIEAEPDKSQSGYNTADGESQEEGDPEAALARGIANLMPQHEDLEYDADAGEDKAQCM